MSDYNNRPLNPDHGFQPVGCTESSIPRRIGMLQTNKPYGDAATERSLETISGSPHVPVHTPLRFESASLPWLVIRGYSPCAKDSRTCS